MGLLRPEERQEIVTTYRLTKSINKTVELTGRSKSVVQRWVGRSKQGLGISHIHKGGAKRIISPAAAKMAVEMLLSGEHSGAEAVAKELASQHATVKVASRNTLINAAKEEAIRSGDPLRFRPGRPKKGLTKANMAQRLAFAKLHRKTKWNDTMFTDRKKFTFRWPGSKVSNGMRTRGQQTRGVFTASHPQCYNVYCGLTIHKMTEPHAVASTSKQPSTFKTKKGEPARNITAAEYKHVLTSTLLPQGQAIFSDAKVKCWVFQQDNDPTHKAAKTLIVHWAKQHRYKVVFLDDWPPNSPDLNPIENVWAYVQARVDQRGCKTFDDFKAAVKEELMSVPKQMLANLVNSMKSRLELVIKRGGDRTGY